MAALKFLLTIILFFLFLQLRAQLPVCSGTNRVIYYQDPFSSTIYNLDLSQANPASVANTITSPPGGFGLVVSNNLNAAAPATTFYTIVNGKYFYYNGTSWVNTNHSAGPGVNAGGGGGFIYNFDGLSIWRYDGTGDATFLINTSPFGSVADIAVDCSGNFYILHNDIPQTLTKYNSSGTVLNVCTVTGAPVFSGGGGIVIFGNDVYYDDLSGDPTNITSPLLHGVINGAAINFVATGININKAADMAACSGGLISSAPVNETICSNQLPFNWNGQNYSASGTYSVTFTGSNGCDSIATLNLTVNAAVTNTVDTSICSSQLPFAWNGQNYSLPGTYSISLTTTGGCDSIVTLHLAINQSPAMPLVVSPVNYCQNQTAQLLSATATGNLIWYTAALGGIGAAITPVPSTVNAGVTNYFVSQSVAGCESPRAMITVNVFESPALGQDKTISICNGESTNLENLYATAGSTTNWSLNQVPAADPASVSTAGIYRLIEIKPSGCADTAFVNLIIQPEVIAFAGNDDSTENDVPYQLSGRGGLQYEWTPGRPLLNDPGIPNPVAILNNTTTFSLIVKDAIGCKGYDTVKIKVIKRSDDIYIPSAFTPNRDGRNDILRPLGTAIERLDYFRVYNRYGELLFETHDLSKGWDGTYKGKDQDMDNYMWTLKALGRNKMTRTMTGNVLLIR